jgi:hypothetical protein
MHHAEALKHLRQFERADLRALLRVDGAAAEVCERSQALAKRCCGAAIMSEQATVIAVDVEKARASVPKCVPKRAGKNGCRR